jgi:hypothetical protein
VQQTISDKKNYSTGSYHVNKILPQSLLQETSGGKRTADGTKGEGSMSRMWKKLYWYTVLCALYYLQIVVPQRVCWDLRQSVQNDGVTEERDRTGILGLPLLHEFCPKHYIESTRSEPESGGTAWASTREHRWSSQGKRRGKKSGEKEWRKCREKWRSQTTRQKKACTRK